MMHITNNKHLHHAQIIDDMYTYSDNTHLENTHTTAHYLSTFDVFTFAFYLFYLLLLISTSHQTLLWPFSLPCAFVFVNGRR